MSDNAHAHAHGHAHGQKGDHVPHVTPLWIYLATWGTLVVLTAVTVGISYLNFGGWNLIIALLIATIKAAVVAALFMHLLHDSKFHTLILVSGGLFLTIFVSFTMFDTEYRGRADAEEAERPADITRPFEGTKSQMKMKAKYDHGEMAAVPAASQGAGHNDAPSPAMSTTPGAIAPAHGEPAASASGSAAGSAAPGTSSPSGSVVTVPSGAGSVPPPPTASISPAPGAPAVPKASAHP